MSLRSRVRQVSAADDTVPASESESQDFQLLCVEETDALCTDADQNLAWKCEFDVNTPESTQVENLSHEESCILLATNAKKQRTEVRLHELTKQERDQFEQAKAAEVANWIQTKTPKVLRNQIPESQILRCRWILTWKPLDTVGSSTGTIRTEPQGKGQTSCLRVFRPKNRRYPKR